MEKIVKNCEISWTGNIPENWEIYRIKELFTLKTGGTPDSNEGIVEERVDTIRWYTAPDFDENYLLSESERNITVESIKVNNYKLFPKNSILMVAIASIGKIGLTSVDCYSNQQITALIPKINNNCNSKFITYSIVASMQYIKDNALYTTVPIINSQFIGNLKYPIPPLKEQNKIVEILDKKCTALNSLIDELQKQIVRLRKYKISFISELLTKGIEIDKMKNTDDKWFKEIPASWKVTKIKYILDTKNGIKVGPFGSSLTDKIVYDNGDIKVYGQWNIISKDFNLDRNFINEKDFNGLSNYEILPGDILVSMMGTIGRCLEVPVGIKKGIMDSHLIKVRLNHMMNSEYFCYFYDRTLSDCIYKQLDFEKNGSIMDGLNSTIVKNLSILVPPLNVQKEIVKYIKEKESIIDTLIEQNQKKIDLFTKYKTSIINEYITGKKRVEVE